MMDSVDQTMAKVENAGGIYIGGTSLSSEATVRDDLAEYLALQKSSSSVTNVALFSKAIPVKLGTYAIMIRMKVSDITKTEKMISVQVRKGTELGALIKEWLISPSMFEVNNKYKVIGSIVEFGEIKGTKMNISASLIKTSATEKVTIDYILVNPAYTSISAV